MGGTGERSERVNKISQILMSSQKPGPGIKETDDVHLR